MDLLLMVFIAHTDQEIRCVICMKQAEGFLAAIYANSKDAFIPSRIHPYHVIYVTK